MTKPVYPVYVQREAINSLFNQITHASIQSVKTTKTESKSSKESKGVTVAASLLQVLGLEAKIEGEKEIGSDYSGEMTFALEPEHKVRQIRELLGKSGTLYDLNSCIMRNRPFGSFVDFRGEGNFKRKLRFVEVAGNIEAISFSMVCSPEYFESQSFLFQALRSGTRQSIVGFGVVLNADKTNKTIEIKPLMLALDTEGFRL